jgi:predicted TIM-barrel fold metal-dependent hydrolase
MNPTSAGCIDGAWVMTLGCVPLAALLSLPKIDAHCHVLDPSRFAYASDVAYRPAGQEQGELRALHAVMDCYAVRHALLVEPNSGYGLDNRCMLEAISRGQGKFKGIAVVPNDCSDEQLALLQSQGVIGIAFNASLNGCAYYASIGPLLKRLESIGMWAQFQVQDDQLLELLPMIDSSGVRVMIDHCGRPNLASDLNQKGFSALLALGRGGQAVVKLSGFAKFSVQGFPFDDAKPYVEALAKNFGLKHCLWASDWPYLKAPYRLDYGPMLALYANLFDLTECEQIMWHSPQALLGFNVAS